MAFYCYIQWLQRQLSSPCVSSSCTLAPVRGLHRLRVLGQRLHGNPFSIWAGSGRRVSSEVLLHWRHPTFASVSWRGHHKRTCWPAEVQVSQVIDVTTHVFFMPLRMTQLLFVYFPPQIQLQLSCLWFWIVFIFTYNNQKQSYNCANCCLGSVLAH